MTIDELRNRVYYFSETQKKFFFSLNYIVLNFILEIETENENIWLSVACTSTRTGETLIPRNTIALRSRHMAWHANGFIQNA